MYYKFTLMSLRLNSISYLGLNLWLLLYSFFLSYKISGSINYLTSLTISLTLVGTSSSENSFSSSIYINYTLSKFTRDL